MKVELDPIDGSTRDYRAVLCENDEDASEGQELGHLHRQEGDEWGFYSTQLMGSVGKCTDEPQFTLKAATLDELCEGLGKRFSAIDLRANRLKNTTMEDYAGATLHGLRQLADETNATAGYVAALADAVAHTMIEDFAKAIPATLKLFDAQVRKCIEERKARAAAHDQIGDLLRAAFGDVLKRGKGEDDAPTQH